MFHPDVVECSALVAVRNTGSAAHGGDVTLKPLEQIRNSPQPGTFPDGCCSAEQCLIIPTSYKAKAYFGSSTIKLLEPSKQVYRGCGLKHYPRGNWGCESHVRFIISRSFSSRQTQDVLFNRLGFEQSYSSVLKHHSSVEK